MTEDTTADIVFLESLSVYTVVGLDAWRRPSRPQPVLLDVRVHTDLAEAGATDDVNATINYGSLCKSINNLIESKGSFGNLAYFAHCLCHTALSVSDGGEKVELAVTLPKGLLLAEGIGLSIVMAKGGNTMDAGKMIVERQSFFVKNLRVPCIIGVNSHERIQKQEVVVNLTFLEFDDELLTGDVYINLMTGLSRVSVKVIPTYRDLLLQYIEDSSENTLESLAAALCWETFEKGKQVKRMMVSVQKPSALNFVGGSGIRITRKRSDHE